jgi:aminopeptidase YwaD
MLQELARVLKSYPIDKELRFVFVGAEEIGLVGSQHYVSQLSEEEIGRSIANFNMDMVGTSWENATAIYMNTLDGKANIVTEAAQAAAERIGTPSELILYQRGASDHVSFYDAGIPAVNFIRREPGTAALEPYYHTPLDTIEHVSAERLKEAGDLVGAAVYSVVRK